MKALIRHVFFSRNDHQSLSMIYGVADQWVILLKLSLVLVRDYRVEFPIGVFSLRI